MNILIVCGGTGGHLFPGIALAEELLERSHQVMILVSEKEIDQKALQRTQGLLIQTLPAIGWRGLSGVWPFALKLLKAVRRSCQIFHDFSPKVVVGMGGFSSVAPLLVAWKKGIPCCIHESNMIAGKANRLTAHLASVVAVGFETAKSQFPGKNTNWTGTPVRAVLKMPKNSQKIREQLGISADMPTVLVMGGSQGGKGLNRLVVDAVGKMNSLEIQWIHLSGMADEAMVTEKYRKLGKKAKVYAFFHQMEDLYAITDLMIARSGASSLAEIAEKALPSILIPYPFATDRHQLANARFFSNAGAAVVLEETNCSGEDLASEIQSILTNEIRRKKMSDAAKNLSCADSHKQLADIVEQLAIKN